MPWTPLRGVAALHALDSASRGGSSACLGLRSAGWQLFAVADDDTGRPQGRKCPAEGTQSSKQRDTSSLSSAGVNIVGMFIGSGKMIPDAMLLRLLVQKPVVAALITGNRLTNYSHDTSCIFYRCRMGMDHSCQFSDQWKSAVVEARVSVFGRL